MGTKLYQLTDFSMLTDNLSFQIEYFNAYNGDLDELSKPDKFTYEVSSSKLE